MAIKILKGIELAKQLGCARTHVSAMKKCGYVFSHGRKTTLKSALNWLAEHPDFTWSQAYPKKQKAAAASN